MRLLKVLGGLFLCTASFAFGWVMGAIAFLGVFAHEIRQMEESYE